MPSRKERYQNRTEILQGTLDLLILQTLQWAPRHGYALSKAIRTNSGEILKVDTGSLYPALHRLERKGWIARNGRVRSLDLACGSIVSRKWESGNCCRSVRAGSVSRLVSRES